MIRVQELDSLKITYEKWPKWMKFIYKSQSFVILVTHRPAETFEYYNSQTYTKAFCFKIRKIQEGLEKDRMR